MGSVLSLFLRDNNYYFTNVIFPKECYHYVVWYFWCHDYSLKCTKFHRWIFIKKTWPSTATRTVFYWKSTVVLIKQRLSILKIFIWKKDKTRRSMPCVYLGSSLNIYKIKKYFEKEISNLDTWPWDDVTVLFQLLFTKENKWYLKRKLTRRI